MLLPQDSPGKDEGKLLTLSGFLLYMVDKARQDIRAVWHALMACGFDLHFERFVLVSDVVPRSLQICLV